MKPTSVVSVSALLVAAAVGLAAPAARAEGCDDQDSEKKNDGKNFHIEYRNGQKVHVIDTVIAVCGKVPRPSVVYVLQAKNINYEWETLKQDFLPLILATVTKAPF
ncbi:MAG: hypothetical protein R3B06_15245 [Kofleriaceae bacterium]